MDDLPTMLPATITVYCAHCRKQLGESEEKHLYARVRCPQGSEHLASVVKGRTGEFWLCVEAAILKWETKYSPIRWVKGWGGVFKARAGWYHLARFGVLVVLLVAASYLPACPILRGILAAVMSLIALFLLLDILISNTSMAFISRFPAHALRTVLFMAFSFLQIAIVFAVLYVLFGTFNRALNPISATYFSAVTITTLGYGDIYLTKDAWIGQVIVVCQLVVGVYFLGTLLAVVAAWANAPPRIPSIRDLNEVLIKNNL
jgi:hypothetical protein